MRLAWLYRAWFTGVGQARHIHPSRPIMPLLVGGGTVQVETFNGLTGSYWSVTRRLLWAREWMGIGERLRVPTHLLRRNILIKRKSTHNPCMIPCGLRGQNPMLLLCHHSFTFPFPAAVPPDIFSLLGYLCIVRHSPWFLLDWRWAEQPHTFALPDLLSSPLGA